MTDPLPIPAGATPEIQLSLHDGSRNQSYRMTRSPFTIGRAPDRDLVLTASYISREHARIVFDGAQYWIEDTNSRHGVLRNGERIQRAALRAGDELRFGDPQGPLLLFGSEQTSETSLRELLGELEPSSQSEIEKLRWFLEAARRLNSTGAVENILASLLEITLELTAFERGFVFLCGDGQLHLAAGRNHKGEALDEDESVSKSALKRALDSAEPYIITDTLTVETGASSASLLSKNIRAVIAVPLRARSREGAAGGETLGLLYLDSRFKPGMLSQVDHDLLRTMAREAAALVENAHLALAEEAARHYREELAFAASIQQRLMAVRLPELPYARIEGRSVPCKEIGGDFFDVLADERGLALVIADVSGKGASAAILASTLQGMIYSQLLAGMPLASVAKSVNAYLCAKDTGKYATMVILRLAPDGAAEYVNCGHIPPLHLRGAGRDRCSVEVLHPGNLPVGLLPEAEFAAHALQASRGDRLVLVSDGIPEAENAAGDFFGEPRMMEAVRVSCADIASLLARVDAFCGATPANDDRTAVQVEFIGGE